MLSASAGVGCREYTCPPIIPRWDKDMKRVLIHCIQKASQQLIVRPRVIDILSAFADISRADFLPCRAQEASEDDKWTGYYACLHKLRFGFGESGATPDIYANMLIS